MAQLSDDCFAFGGELMRADEAIGILTARVSTIAGTESAQLSACRGRILADDLVATGRGPPHDNVAVDGYAVAFNDLNPAGETRLKLAGRVAAGQAPGPATMHGTALRVFTGAPMPAGLDTCFMQEDCRADGDHVVLPPGIKRGANRRKAGEDVKAGTTILKRGQRLRPQDIGLAASIGKTELSVYRTLTVGVFSTGDELREPGGEPPAGGGSARHP